MDRFRERRDKKYGAWKNIRANALSRMHCEKGIERVERTFYNSGIWINILKGRYNTCFQQAMRTSEFLIKELNPYNSGPDYMQSLTKGGNRYEVLRYSKINED